MSDAKTLSWLALAIAISSSVGANVALKLAVAKTKPNWLDLLFEPLWWIGIVLAVVLLAAYLYAIRAVPISVAYPSITGMAMVGIACVGILLLGENLSGMQVAGVALITSGVFLLATA